MTGRGTFGRRVLLSFLLGSLLCSLAVGALLLWWLAPAQAPAQRIFVNGQILSLDGENRVVEALAVRGQRIYQLGSRAEIEALVDADTVFSDLAGNTLMPGFIDAHGHFPGSGLAVVAADLNSPPVGDVTTLAELQQRLTARLDTGADDDWITGFGYDDTLLVPPRHPDRDDLDAVSSELPIYITHVSGHIGVANSRALALLGIDAASANPPGGLIVRRPGSAEPNGRLEEAAHLAVGAHSMDFSLLDSLKMVRHASAEYASQGVTTAQSGAVDRSLAEGLATLSRFGLIPMRLVLMPFYDTLGAQWLAGDFEPAAIAGDKLIVGPVKIIADGSIQAYTAYLSRPYHVPYQGAADYRGYPALNREQLRETVMAFHNAGLQLAIHGNGDAAIDDILYAFAAALQQRPAADPRLVLIHAQMARDDQLQKMLELGVSPSFFSAHTYYWGDRHRDIFMGPARAARMSPTGSAQALGLRYSVHLDTPVVPMQPLQLLWSTVQRRSTSGALIGAAQRVSPLQALRAMTVNAAWQIFQEQHIGSLEAGKYADLVILDGDPLQTEDVRTLEVVETIVGGVTIFERH